MAGLRLAFAAAPGLRVTPPDGPHAAFLGAAPPAPGAEPDAEVRVDVDTHGAGYRPAGACVFDTGHGWRLWADGETRTAELTDPARGGAPLWRASWRAPLQRVEASVPRELAPGGRVDHLVQYPLDQILLTEALYPRGRLLVHAAGGRAPCGGIAFCGPSGAGKSTVTRLLGGHAGYRFLSDDRLFVDLPRPARPALRVHGTPWPGDAGVARNEAAPLSALCFLQHAATTRLTALAPRDALERLLPVTTLPWFDRARIGAAIEDCARLVAAVRCFRLDFRPEAGALADALAALDRAG